MHEQNVDAPPPGKISADAHVTNICWSVDDELHLIKFSDCIFETG